MFHVLFFDVTALSCQTFSAITSVFVPVDPTITCALPLTADVLPVRKLTTKHWSSSLIRSSCFCPFLWQIAVPPQLHWDCWWSLDDRECAASLFTCASVHFRSNFDVVRHLLFQWWRPKRQSSILDCWSVSVFRLCQGLRWLRFFCYFYGFSSQLTLFLCQFLNLLSEFRITLGTRTWINRIYSRSDLEFWSCDFSLAISRSRLSLWPLYSTSRYCASEISEVNFLSQFGGRRTAGIIEDLSSWYSLHKSYYLRCSSFEASLKINTSLFESFSMTCDFRMRLKFQSAHHTPICAISSMNFFSCFVSQDFALRFECLSCLDRECVNVNWLSFVKIRCDCVCESVERSVRLGICLRGNYCCLGLWKFVQLPIDDWQRPLQTVALGGEVLRNLEYSATSLAN